MIQVRPFARRDREQLVRLVNAHVATAMPGASVPPALLLSQLEHPVGEPIVGPWIIDQATFVAVERDQIVGAGHLWRYGPGSSVGDDYRDAGEIAWMVCWPQHLDAGRAVLDAALAHLEGWKVRVFYADGTLPVPGVYGVSDSWPHVQQLYRDAGFDEGSGQVEVVFAGPLAGFPPPGTAPVEGLTLRRQVGPMAIAFHAAIEGEVVGSYEVDSDLSRGGANQSVAGWADECNHWEREDLRNRGIGTWLVAHAADWLRLGGVSRFLAYAIEDDQIEHIERFERYGLRPINRTLRGWRHDGMGSTSGSL